jgi:hypothetical protein
MTGYPLRVLSASSVATVWRFGFHIESRGPNLTSSYATPEKSPQNVQKKLRTPVIFTDRQASEVTDLLRSKNRDSVKKVPA